MSEPTKTAVVTGAAVGIGQEVSRKLANDGFHVVGIDVQDGGETVELIEDDGGSAEFREADVTDEDAMRSALDGLDIDCVVNNAAIWAPLADNKRPFYEIPTDEWDEVMAVNVKGIFVTTKEAYPGLNEGASVVNVGSNTAITGVTGILHYVASKGAVMSMTRALANELSDRSVTVNAVLPGLTMSEASLQSPDEYIESVVDQQAIEQELQPEHIADAVSFLAGPESELISGQMLNVDGGLTFY